MTFPTALILPLVSMFPTVALPATLTKVNVPTEVMFGCAAVVTVPAVIAVVAVVALPAVVANVALATAPTTLAPATEFAVSA